MKFKVRCRPHPEGGIVFFAHEGGEEFAIRVVVSPDGPSAASLARSIEGSRRGVVASVALFRLCGCAEATAAALVSQDLELRERYEALRDVLEREEGLR